MITGLLQLKGQLHLRLSFPCFAPETDQNYLIQLFFYSNLKLISEKGKLWGGGVLDWQNNIFYDQGISCDLKHYRNENEKTKY